METSCHAPGSHTSTSPNLRERAVDRTHPGSRHGVTWSPRSQHTNHRQTQTHPSEGHTRRHGSTRDTATYAQQTHRRTTHSPALREPQGRTEAGTGDSTCVCSYSARTYTHTHTPVWMLQCVHVCYSVCALGRGPRGEARSQHSTF